ncbi:hypothetical protein [Halalkalibacter krulwichiae]|uniref:Telomeric repeat-binding factor 2 n=1 Tax=Halalkalibacter krulwichiae TaxID=199441 RepID=A0A1X9MFL2_9BACI|nr:hypothetical protein [Halalkalibacter krulwichiae]ARK32245.1 hypothetical protein BkAM31D_21630 [Halalkalibacter krulwichiae]
MLKKVFIIGLSAFMLAACGEEAPVEEETAPAETVEEEDAPETETTEPEEASADGEFRKEFDEEVANTDNFRATLMSVEKVVDEDWDEEKILVTFEVENKMDETIEVQAREVSADGRMVDEALLFMSQEVSGGKLADAVLTIQNYDGDLPNIEDHIEMTLHVFSWDDYDFSEDHDVRIELGE